MEHGLLLETAPRSASNEFRDEVWRGLSQRQKAIPSRYFYDDLGSDLFETITTLPEYYPTRTEIALLQHYGPEIALALPSRLTVVEFGSGSSRKTELLLKALRTPAAYVPIEISAAALRPAAQRIAKAFPFLTVYPILGGFHELDRLRVPMDHGPRLGFFPGSTIGNLAREEAISFLASARRLLGAGSAFLIGVDLKKSLDILLPAYNDAQGITAGFNLNILSRINRELDGTFDLSGFRHEAMYREAEGRIEMHLRARFDQSASVAGRAFSFAEGETIHTENSHKYDVSEFHDLARAGGWRPVNTWIDRDRLFSLHLFV